MDPDDEKYAAALRRLLEMMNRLRAECPWDRKQTLESLRHLTIEESHELADAILDGDTEEIKKELGDLLLHIVFYAKIASEQAHFDFADIVDTLCDKVIARHPHVYGEDAVSDAAQVKQNWEKLKLREHGGTRSILAGVPASLPALIKAQRVQEKARGVGFDWPEKESVWHKVEEELDEFKQCVERAGKGEENEDLEGEFGDLLFSLVNYARFLHLNAETALEKTNKKFIRRFHFIEQAAREQGKALTELDLEEMDRYWEQAKAAGL